MVVIKMSSEANQAEQKPSGKQNKKRVRIDMPKDLVPLYANVAFISHTPAEMVLDFAQVLPHAPRGRVQARIIMTPMHAKMLQAALAKNVANFERQFGEIRLPQRGPSLADSFFRFPQDGKDDQDE